MAGFPFFIVTFSGFDTSFFALHFTQYIVDINITHPLSSVIRSKPRLEFQIIVNRSKIENNFKRNYSQYKEQAFFEIRHKEGGGSFILF